MAIGMSNGTQPTLLSIACDTLVPNQPIAFNLYYRNRDKQYKKLLQADTPYTESLKALLDRKSVATLYIASRDKSKYQLYLKQLRKNSGFIEPGHQAKVFKDAVKQEAVRPAAPRLKELPLKKLLANVPVDFPVYMANKEGGVSRLLAKGQPFDVDAQGKVFKQGYPKLMIQKDHWALFKAYLQKNTPPLILDETDSVEKKAHKLHTHATDAMENLIDDPKCSWSYNRAKGVVDHLVDLIHTDNGAIKALTETSVAEYHLPVHSFDVAVFAIGFGLHLGLERDDLLRLGYAGIFHDIGKSCVEKQVIEKNGLLDTDEFESIKKHAKYSSFILRSHTEMDKKVLDAVKHHHECFDGTGYPDRLVGDEIPLFAQILSIADVYDAVTSKKPYRDAFTSFETLALMTKDMASHFDKRLLLEFIKYMGPQYK